MKLSEEKLEKYLIDYALDTGNRILFNIMTDTEIVKKEYIKRMLKRLESLAIGPGSKLVKVDITGAHSIQSMVASVIRKEFNVGRWIVKNYDGKVRRCRTTNDNWFSYWVEGGNVHILLEYKKEEVK